MISQSGKNTDHTAGVKGFLIQKEGESIYCIENYDKMDPFLMSIVSSSDLWMYLSSRGGLTAGRQNYNNALFPYETDDKIHVADEITGPKTIIRLQSEGKLIVWEPFSDRYQGDFAVKRNLCKNIAGNKIIFEEENLSLGLVFSYCWSSCDELGWVRKSVLKNLSDATVELDVTDGLLNVLPWGITRDTQSTMSTLMDAYKIAEILPDTRLALYRMSSIPVDRAEPSEALRTNTVWSTGLENTKIIFGYDQLTGIRKGKEAINQHSLLGQRTSFLVQSRIILPGKGSKTWYIMADVAKDSSDVVFFQKQIQSGVITPDYIDTLLKKSEAKLTDLVTMADGIQETGDLLNDRRHFANVMFNIMRGGIFENNYQVELNDFLKHLQVASKKVWQTCKSLYDRLNPVVNIQELTTIASSSENTDLLRLTLEYLPLSFSRRHGDPSRPWNYFDINVKNADGTPSLDYQGNWRDIFQNWETLAFSFPAFLPGMIARFLNASTADGYNPYRIMRDGFDWEVPEPDNPWAFIGYWGDHQIIYLLRLLEMQEKFYPGLLAKEINQPIFVYANVPYRIKKHNQILLNPQDTIEFDRELNETILKNVQIAGTDAKLLTSNDGNLHKATFSEKAFLTLLTKISNLVPEAGIWLNTQRPEWNDANNALVGNGASMVTLYHLRRFVMFLSNLIAASPDDQFVFSAVVRELFTDINNNLTHHQQLLANKFTDTDRKTFIDKNGLANEKYRERIYVGFSSNHAHLSKSELDAFLGLALRFLDHSIIANERADGMYHSYNLLDINTDSISVDHLYLMLEGQVAILNSGVLDSSQVIKLLDALFASDLWRKDQQSFMLYPFRKLPDFLEKNIIPREQIEGSVLLKLMIRENYISILKEDADGNIHFNAALKNSRLLLDRT
jgi:hypothetical protein